jgi:RNA polymerase sigma-70 factor (ECF subfamily)
VSCLTPDAELVAAARRGSPAAFREIVARHQQAVRSFLRRVLDEAADADDLAQETFLAAWASLGRFRGGASLRSWLCAIAWNKRLSLLRSRRRAVDREAALARWEAPPGPSPDQSLDLQAALRRLPEAQRAAVALCLGGGFSHAEAAQVLGAPVGTIKSHVERGRARLAAALGDEP